MANHKKTKPARTGECGGLGGMNSFIYATGMTRRGLAGFFGRLLGFGFRSGLGLWCGGFGSGCLCSGLGRLGGGSGLGLRAALGLGSLRGGGFGLGCFDLRGSEAEGFLQAIDTVAEGADEAGLLAGGVHPDVDILRLDTDLGSEVLHGDAGITGLAETGEDEVADGAALGTLAGSGHGGGSGGGDAEGFLAGGAAIADCVTIQDLGDLGFDLLELGDEGFALLGEGQDGAQGLAGEICQTHDIVVA